MTVMMFRALERRGFGAPEFGSVVDSTSLFKNTSGCTSSRMRLDSFAWILSLSEKCKVKSEKPVLLEFLHFLSTLHFRL
jgi:hypothetical protein